MGRKGRKCVRSSKAVSRMKYPIGTLAARRRAIREEHISSSSIYNTERKRLKLLKEKVATPTCTSTSLLGKGYPSRQES